MQPSRRQLGVAVQRDDVAGVGSHARRVAEVDERAHGASVAAIRGVSQQRDQLFELAALALPADPASLGVAVAAFAVQHDEARRRRHRRRRLIDDWQAAGRVARIQRIDLLLRIVQQASVGRQRHAVGIGPVGQQRELRMALGVCQVVQLQPVHQGLGRGGIGQHRGDHDHHPVLGWNACRQRQPRQVRGPGRFTDQPVDHRHHGLRRREQHQQASEQRPPPVHPGIAQTGDVPQQHPGDQADGHGDQRTQVQRQGRAAGHGLPGRGAAFVQAERADQGGATGACQPVACDGGRVCSGRTVRGRVAGRLHQTQQRAAHGDFAQAALPRQPLDTVQRLIARHRLFGLEHRGGQHQAHQRAAARHDVGPIGVADRAQRRHRIAHAQVVRRLVGALLRLHQRRIGQRTPQPVVLLRAVVGPVAGALLHHRFGAFTAHGRLAASVLHALRHLAEEHPAHATLVQQREQLVE